MSNILNRSKNGAAPTAEGTAGTQPSGLQDKLRWTRRLLEALGRDVTRGGLDLRAMSLVYTTLLSLAPLLAVSFSVLKGFGVQNQMRPVLIEMVAPVGEKGVEIVDRIIGFVNNMQVGVLGFTGFALLFFTVLSLIQKIEDSFNQIWRVPRSRSFRRRFSDYLSVLLVGPVLVFSALGLTASMANNRFVQMIVAQEPFGTLYYVLGLLLPNVLIIAALTFVYLFIPNTAVRLKAALAGGIVAGLAWRGAGWLFARFVAGSTQYAAIYSSFAILIVFMIWIYVNWLILLVGGQVSFYVQHPRYLRTPQRDFGLSAGLFRKAGLLILYLLADRFRRGETPWTVGELANRLDLPTHGVERLLTTLRQRGLVLEIDSEQRACVPARDLEAMPLGEILDALDSEPADGYPFSREALSAPAVEWLEDRLRECRTKTVEGMSLRSFAEIGDRTGHDPLHRPTPDETAPRHETGISGTARRSETNSDSY